jgi:hypothetical protein
LGIDFVGDKPLQSPDIKGLIYLTPVAGILATMVTDTTTDAGEWVILLDDPQRILVTPFTDKSNVPLCPLAGWTGIPARSDAQLFNSIRIGHRLRVKFECGTAHIEMLVELVREYNRADIGAISAAHTLVQVNVARFVLNTHRKITGRAAQLNDLGIGHQLDIDVSAHIDQLGANGAHGAVIGGKSLV